MYERKKKYLYALVTMIILSIALYAILMAQSNDDTFRNLATFLAFPVLSVLLSNTFNEWNEHSDNLKKAEKNEKLKELGIISNKEYEYRKKEIIKLENRTVENNHKELKKDEIDSYKN